MIMRLAPTTVAFAIRRQSASSSIVVIDVGDRGPHRRHCRCSSRRQLDSSSTTTTTTVTAAASGEGWQSHKWQRERRGPRCHRGRSFHVQPTTRGMSASSSSIDDASRVGGSAGGWFGENGGAVRKYANASNGSNNANNAGGGRRGGSGGRGGGGGGSGNRNSNRKKAVDPNAPLANEHLIAELFNRRRGVGVGGPESLTADNYEIRLIVDLGWTRRDDGVEYDSDDDDDSDDDVDDDDESEVGEGTDEGAGAGRSDDGDDDGDDGKKDDGDSDSSESSTPSARSSKSKSSSTSTQLTTLSRAITIAHEHSLDLIGITLASNPPVIKAVDLDRHLYQQKRRAAKALSAKKKGGKGAISDRPLKEFKFRAGIADHDLLRKANNMTEYLGRGHAVRVTLTARQRSLKDDADAISTTLDRLRELVGDKAVEARGMKANDRNSYGTLLLHPSKK